jgi:adhesin/invasin
MGYLVSLYATGEGQTTPAGVDGKLAPLNPPYPKPVANVTATVGGQPAQVTYYGAAPGEVEGLMQVNVQIPAGVQPGDVPVVISVGGVASPPGVTLAVTQ